MSVSFNKSFKSIHDSVWMSHSWSKFIFKNPYLISNGKAMVKKCLWAVNIHFSCWRSCVCVSVSVCEVVQTLQLSSDRERSEVVGDLSVCLDGLQVDAETFASEEQKHSETCFISAVFQQQFSHLDSLLFKIEISHTLSCVMFLFSHRCCCKWRTQTERGCSSEVK